MDYNTRLQSNNAELNEIYNALISLPETESDVIRLQYDPGEQIENAQAVYEAFQNGKYILVEGEHTFFSTKTGNTVTATFAIPLISANSDYTFEFKGADSYDNVIYLAYIQVSGWVDVIIERGDPKLQDKATTPNQWTQTIQADFEEYDGLGVVTVYPIPDEYIVPSGTLEIIENGEYDVTDKADVIVSVESAPVAVEEKDVNFYDYDGTLLYSYTLDEIQTLTELPTPPTPPKDFLLFDEWNWTLADIKAYNNPLQVGAIYKTIDGKTYAVIQIEEDWQKSVTVRYCQWCSSITVDWGDGTAEAPTTTGSGTNITKTHTYANKGTYIITIDADGTWNMGLNSATGTFFGSPNNNESAALREVYIGNGARLLGSAFSKAFRLEKCTIPKTATKTWSAAFCWCSSLKAVIFPSTFKTIAANSFDYAMDLSVVSLSKSITEMAYYSFNYTKVKRMTLPPAKNVYLGGNSVLKQIIIPEGIETLGEPCNAAYNIKDVTIPSTVTNISANSFLWCWSLLRIRFKSATPPTVANANAFKEIPATCIVEVPDLATYQAATNYGTIATQMVEV